MKSKIITIALLILVSNFTFAATDIGLGTLKAVKVYDLGNDKSIRVYFNDDVTFENPQCSKSAVVT